VPVSSALLLLFISLATTSAKIRGRRQCGNHNPPYSIIHHSFKVDLLVVRIAAVEGACVPSMGNLLRMR
jgi:hypothetical protein